MVRIQVVNCAGLGLFLVLQILATLSASQDYNDTTHQLIKLPKQINSLFEESKPIYHENTRTLIFTRSNYAQNVGGEETGPDTWVSSMASGQWSESSNKLSFNDPGSNIVIGFSSSTPDRFYFLKYLHYGGNRYAEVWQSNCIDSFTSKKSIGIKPIRIGSHYHDFYMHPSEEVILLSYKGLDTMGEEDLYLLTKDSLTGWRGPFHLGTQVNTTGFEISPFLSPDGQKLYFASNGLAGYGDADIWVSKREGDGWLSWSKPENLGNLVNSEQFDAYFSFATNDEAFFVSNRDSEYTDVYQLKKKRQIKRKKSLIAKNTDSPSIQKKFHPQTLQLFFPYDQFELTEEAINRLNFFIDQHPKDKIDKIEIVGYTDIEGSLRYNLELSYKRANSTMNFLRANGFDNTQMEAWGEGMWPDKNSDPTIMRQVTISIYSSSRK